MRASSLSNLSHRHDSGLVNYYDGFWSQGDAFGCTEGQIKRGTGLGIFTN